MSETWRVIDTGLRSSAQNIALTRALLEARQAEEIPSTLRFLRFTPGALLACNQSAEQELNLDYCNANGIAVQRRITGGGAVYVDEAQLVWELHLHRRDLGACDMQAIAKRVCHAAAAAISALGVDARFRPRGDIEVDGRAICVTGGTFDRDAFVYQGMLFIDSDVAKMLQVLRTPVGGAPPEWAIAAAHERVCSLQDLLRQRADIPLLKRNLVEAFESEFDVEFHDGDLNLSEQARYRTALAGIDTVDWVNLVRRPVSDMPVCDAVQKFTGSLLRVGLTYDRFTHRIKQVWFTGDICVSPRRTIADLEAALCDTSVERLEHNVRVFFARCAPDMLLLAPDDFIVVMRRALKFPLVVQSP